MRRARLWIVEKLLAAARAVAGDASEEEEGTDVDLAPAAVLSPTALAMLLEGEAAADAELEKVLAERRKAHEPEPPRAGSLRERIEKARRNA